MTTTRSGGLWCDLGGERMLCGERFVVYYSWMVGRACAVCTGEDE